MARRAPIQGGGGSSTPSGAAGGDLSGTYPNPSVAKIAGKSVTISGLAAGDVIASADGVTLQNIPFSDAASLYYPTPLYDVDFTAQSSPTSPLVTGNTYTYASTVGDTSINFAYTSGSGTPVATIDGTDGLKFAATSGGTRQLAYVIVPLTEGNVQPGLGRVRLWLRMETTFTVPTVSGSNAVGVYIEKTSGGTQDAKRVVKGFRAPAFAEAWTGTIYYLGTEYPNITTQAYDSQSNTNDDVLVMDFDPRCLRVASGTYSGGFPNAGALFPHQAVSPVVGPAFDAAAGQPTNMMRRTDGHLSLVLDLAVTAGAARACNVKFKRLRVEQLP